MAYICEVNSSGAVWLWPSQFSHGQDGNRDRLLNSLPVVFGRSDSEGECEHEDFAVGLEQGTRIGIRNVHQYSDRYFAQGSAIIIPEGAPVFVTTLFQWGSSRCSLRLDDQVFYGNCARSVLEGAAHAGYIVISFFQHDEYRAFIWRSHGQTSPLRTSMFDEDAYLARMYSPVQAPIRKIKVVR